MGSATPITTDFSHDVFLSHTDLDKPRVRTLAERLRAAGLRVWFDEWSIRPGDDIYLAIERGLQSARVQVLCLSPAALRSNWMELERSTVLFRDPTNEGRRFIPLLLQPCDLPDALRRYKHVDYRDAPDAAFSELLEACHPAEIPAQARPSPRRSRARKAKGTDRQPRVETRSVLEHSLQDDELHWARSIAVSPDGNWVAAGYNDGLVAIWDLPSNSLQMKCKSHRSDVQCVLFTSDGKQCISASSEIIVWEATTGRLIQRLSSSVETIRAVTLMQPGQRLLFGGDDGRLRLQQSLGERTRTFRSGREEFGGITSVAAGRNPDEALTGHEDGSVRLWSLAARQMQGRHDWASGYGLLRSHVA